MLDFLLDFLFKFIKMKSHPKIWCSKIDPKIEVSRTNSKYFVEAKNHQS